MEIYKNLERYAPEITVYSDLSPEGRVEYGFIQPLDLTTETAELLLDGGEKYGRYLLIASTETISDDENSVYITWAGRKFELIRREQFGISDLLHIECLIRCIGGEPL